VFASDAGLLGRGFMYAGRPGYMGFNFGGFAVQLVSPKTDTLDGLLGGVTVDADKDVMLPKIEAAYTFAADTWNVAVRGGAQTYSYKDALIAGDREDINVTSYGIGADGGVNIGPGYVRGGISWTQNGGNARWTAAAASILDGDDINDVTTLQWGLVGGLKMSDMMSFEGGFGWRQDDLDNDALEEDSPSTWEIYVQGVFALAPGVYVIPEVGYIDNADDTVSGEDDTGYSWYAGAKWQIDF
jgi:hypothetical protein